MNTCGFLKPYLDFHTKEYSRFGIRDSGPRFRAATDGNSGYPRCYFHAHGDDEICTADTNAHLLSNQREATGESHTKLMDL